MSGSSALQPLVNAAKEKFEASHKGMSVEVSAGGSKKGLTDVASGAVQIGDSDIFAPPDLQGQLIDHKRRGRRLRCHGEQGAVQREGQGGLDARPGQGVHRAMTTNWKDLGGRRSRSSSSIARPTPERAPSSGASFSAATSSSKAQTEDNSGALVAKLKQTKGAISYLALSFADPEMLMDSG